MTGPGNESGHIVPARGVREWSRVPHQRNGSGPGMTPLHSTETKEGAEAPRSVFIRQNAGEHGCGCVAGSDVEFQRVLLSGDGDREKDLVGIT